MDPGNDRFKHVWEETQDNLEAVVGSAVSGWARFHAAQTHNPVWTQVRELLSGCGGCCCGWARRVKTSGGGAGGRDDASFDIFQDLYGDDGELERLLSNNEAFDDDNDGYANRSGENNDDFGEFQQASARWNSKPQKHTRNRSSMSNLMSSLFPGTPAAPAAATAGNRARSDTSRSSDTFRSRTELLGPDPAGDDDAQIMSDGFETSLAFRADGGGASSTASSTHGADSNLAGVGGAGEEEHSEEVSIERELEERPPLPDTNPLTEPAANLSSNHEISSTDELPSGQPETTTSASS